MAKKNAATIIHIDGKPVEFAPAAKLVVVKMASIVDHRSGADWPQTGPTVVNGPKHVLTPITIEAGVSMVSASLWAKHVEAENPNLEIVLGDVKLYKDIAAMANAHRSGELIKIVAVSRHGQALRALFELERDSDRPRQALMDALGKRRRFYETFAPAQFDTVAQMALTVAQRGTGPDARSSGTVSEARA